MKYFAEPTWLQLFSELPFLTENSSGIRSLFCGILSVSSDLLWRSCSSSQCLRDRFTFEERVMWNGDLKIFVINGRFLNLLTLFGAYLNETTLLYPVSTLMEKL